MEIFHGKGIVLIAGVDNAFTFILFVKQIHEYPKLKACTPRPSTPSPRPRYLYIDRPTYFLITLWQKLGVL